MGRVIMPSARVMRMETIAAAGVGLIPPTRPQLIGEVLDAGFRLFRVSWLKCLPLSAASVIVAQAPTFYDSVSGGSMTPFIDKGWGWWTIYLLSAVFSVWMLGWVQYRQSIIARLEVTNFKREARDTLRRLPGAVLLMLAYLALLGGLIAAFSEAILPAPVLFVALGPLLWFGLRVSLAPYLYWCAGHGAWPSVVGSFRVTRRQVWRLTAMFLVTVMTIAVFYFVIAIVLAVLTPAADVAVLLALNAVVAVLAGAVGLPFATALVIVAAEDLAIRQRVAAGPV